MSNVKKGLILWAVILFLTGIGIYYVIKSEHGIGENGEWYDNYQEACDDGEFAAAYFLVDKMKKDALRTDSIDKKQRLELEAEIATKEIVKSELGYLISTGTDEDVNRAFYVFNNKHDQVWYDYDDALDFIIDNAITYDNKAMLKRLLGIISSDEYKDKIDRINEYLNQN